MRVRVLKSRQKNASLKSFEELREAGALMSIAQYRAMRTVAGRDSNPITWSKASSEWQRLGPRRLDREIRAAYRGRFAIGHDLDVF
jgi:hypothetical protein